MRDRSSGKSLIDELPRGVKENLSPGEEVVRYLKTFELVERPDYIILTNFRIVYFNEERLGRYDFRSTPFEKFLQMRAHRGAMCGEISASIDRSNEI